MKVVLDTNVFIDAFFGVCEDCKLILRKEHNGEFSLIMSTAMTEELIRMIESSMNKIDMTSEERVGVYRVLLRALRRTEPVEPKTKFNKCVDKDDNVFIACAIDGGADYIISRDAHIHNLKETITNLKNKHNNPIKILYPDQFVLELDKLKLVTHFNNK